MVENRNSFLNFFSSRWSLNILFSKWRIIFTFNSLWVVFLVFNSLWSILLGLCFVCCNWYISIPELVLFLHLKDTMLITLYIVCRFLSFFGHTRLIMLFLSQENPSHFFIKTMDGLFKNFRLIFFINQVLLKRRSYWRIKMLIPIFSWPLLVLRSSKLRVSKLRFLLHRRRRNISKSQPIHQLLHGLHH